MRYAVSDELGKSVTSAELPSDRANATRVDELDVALRLPAGAGRYIARIEVTDGRRVARRQLALTVRRELVQSSSANQDV